MNKAEASVIDLGTIQHGHRDGIFSIRRCTYCITDHCLAVSNVALSRTSLLLVPRIDTCWTFTLQTMNILCTIPFQWQDNAQRRNRGCVTACFPSPTTHWPHYGGGGRGERPSCFQSQVRGGGQVRAGETILMKGTWSVRWEECTWRGKVPAAVSSGGKTARAALERLLLSPWAEGRSGELTPEGWWWPGC